MKLLCSKPEVTLTWHLYHAISRTDVLTVTPWLAPIVWEGTFDPLLLDNIYRSESISVALTVFAVGK